MKSQVPQETKTAGGTKKKKKKKKKAASFRSSVLSLRKPTRSHMGTSSSAQWSQSSLPASPARTLTGPAGFCGEFYVDQMFVDICAHVEADDNLDFIKQR